MPEPQHIDLPEEAVKGVPGLKQARDAFDVAYFGHGRSWQDALTLALLFAAASIRKQERERLREAIYQELTHRYMPDHELIRHLDAAEAALDAEDSE